MEYLASAALLVQPSLYEGFGLPPLEAMVLGTHSLISDIPVFKEIYAGYPVTFFKAGDTKDLKGKMTALLSNKPALSPVLSDELLLKYTFEKTSSVILKNLYDF
jgi:glycosyltransferase involved in cell wall biosynthesis